MATTFRILLYAPDADRAMRASDAAFARINELEAHLSDWNRQSELSTVVRAATEDAGLPVAIGADLARVVARAQEISRVTDGAFDITVGPCVQLWRRAFRQGALPERDALALALAATDYRKLTLDPGARTLTLAIPGMALDLGGIAKGDALDEALKVLREHGIERALVVGGGDVVAGQAPPDRAGWIVGLAELAVDVDAPAPEPRLAVTLADAAISISGDTYRYIEVDGVRYSHIVDPRDGMGLTRRVLAAVMAGDGATADALATALSVIGAEGVEAVLREFPGTAARLITLESGALTACASTGWPPMMPAPSDHPPAEHEGERDDDPSVDPP